MECHLQANENLEVGLVIIWLYLWVTFAVVLASTIMRIVRLLLVALMPVSYRVKRLGILVLADPTSDNSEEAVAREFRNFARTFLRPDGALILEILEENVSMAAASGIARAAWQQFKSKRCDITEARTSIANAPAQAQNQNQQPPMYPELGYASGGDVMPLMPQEK